MHWRVLITITLFLFNGTLGYATDRCLLILEGERLGDVATLISRERKIKLLIDDPQLAATRLGGVLDFATAAETIAQWLARKGYCITRTVQLDGTLRISPSKTVSCPHRHPHSDY